MSFPNGSMAPPVATWSIQPFPPNNISFNGCCHNSFCLALSDCRLSNYDDENERIITTISRCVKWCLLSAVQ